MMKKIKRIVMSNNISNYRRFFKMTQDELAKMLDISVVTLGKYEKTKYPGDLSLTIIQGILNIFNTQTRPAHEEITFSDLISKE